MRSRLGLGFWCLSLGFGAQLAGCSSEAIGGDDNAAGAPDDRGGRAGSGTGGRAAAGGSAGENASRGGAVTAGAPAIPSELPDYVDSPCYGETATTAIYNGETHETEALTATCRGETERVRLYVSDDLFDGRIDQAQVNGFLHRYELVGHEGSARPELGVLGTDEAIFGELRLGAANDKLLIFVFDTRNAGEGYLCSWCGTSTELHLDGTRLSPLDGDLALSIAAHETFHAIHRGYDPNEEVWLDETMAQAAMSVNGFFTDRAVLNDFARNSNVVWGPSAEVRDFHYGAGLALGTYLWEFGGPDFMRAITASPNNGWAGIDAGLRAIERTETPIELFLNMAVALYLDAPERGYGFRAFDLVQGVRTDGAASGNVQPYGLVYYALSAGVTAIELAGSADLRAVLVEDADPVVVTPVERGVEVEVTSEGQVLIVTNAGDAAGDYAVTEL